MTKIHLKRTTHFDLQELSKVMRKEDKDEVYAAEGLGPLDALVKANAVSRDTCTAWADGRVLCSLGVIPLTKVGSTASPWFLSSHYLPEHPRALLYYSNYAVAAWSQQYDLLVNFVDARYTKSVRWLRKIGFTVHDPEPYGFSQLPFHMFELRSN